MHQVPLKLLSEKTTLLRLSPHSGGGLVHLLSVRSAELWSVPNYMLTTSPAHTHPVQCVLFPRGSCSFSHVACVLDWHMQQGHGGPTSCHRGRMGFALGFAQNLQDVDHILLHYISVVLEG